MTTTTMRFGPEWMRKQPASAKPLATSPPPSGTPGGNSNGGTPAPPAAASYSALVTPHAPPEQGKRDIAHPFKYSRDEILQVYKDIGACSELPIEVERWEGIVREVAGEPVSLSDFTEVERKLYATSVNSETRRRQPSDYAAQGDRSKGGTLTGGLSNLMGRRRRGDSSSGDHPPLSLPRKTSWSSTSGNILSPSTTSPRTRIGSSSGIDDVLNGDDTAWGGGKRRVVSGQPFSDRLDEEEETRKDREGPPDAKTSNTSTPGEKSEAAGSHTPRNQDSNVDVNTAATSLSNLTLRGNARQGDSTGGNTADPADLAKVEWSYIDPSGNVQGPFTGETMQRWNDQHYFTDDLMMKRTTLDTEFLPLAEIKRRAQGAQVFISPLSNDAPPPGLGHLVPGPGLNPVLQRTGVMGAPRQPSPQSYGRSNTLDSFINTTVTATVSGSPSSSFGGSLARGPLSPDPVTVGSRLHHLASDAALNGRVSVAGSYSSNSSPAMPQAVRQIFNEPPQPNRSASFDTQANIPWQISESSGMQGWNGSSDVSHLSQPGRFEQMAAPSFGHDQFVRDSSPYAVATGAPSADPFFSSPAPPHGFYDQPNALGTPFQQMARDPSRFEGVQQQSSLPLLNTSFNRGFEQQAVASPSVISTSASNFQHYVQTRPTPPLSPWGAPQTRDPTRPRPFDADQPTSNNTFVASPQTTTWNRSQPDIRTKDPWSSSLQNLDQGGQGQLTEEPQSLTTANVTQHNEQQNLLDSRNHNVPYPSDQADISTRVAVDTITTAPTQVSGKQASVVLTSPAKEAPVQQPSTKRKSGAVPTPVAAEKAQPTSVDPASKAPAASPAPQKAAWATDSVSKAKSSPAPMNLRDIQEAEKKRQEARKNAEKGRERAARAASATSPSEEVQFTASWGLPTSQVGARSNGAASVKETSGVSTATTSAPVWTNTAKPAAKTMKEIQEEEERRKQAAKERETAAAAVKRAAQAAPVKPPVVNVQSSGGPWTVVGSGGKSAASVAAARSTPVAQASTPNAQATASRATATHRPASSPVVAKAASSTSKADEEPRAPSLEFLKWMRESLRGLNSSVQFEELAQMLLSFPLEPDKATKEIIAETVYGASTTLNGRDFAEEFIRRRKEDALSRPKGVNSQAGNGKVASLADVVKAQPKQQQNDFGAFKVVKKKNKRS